MANTIKETITLSINGANFSASLTGTQTTQQVGSNYTEESQTATTSAPVLLDINADISEGDLGWLLIRNIAAPVTGVVDANQPFVDVATDNAMAHKIATIMPGKGAFIPVPGGTKAIYVQGNLVDVPLVFLAVEK